MSVDSVLAIVLGISVASLVVAWFLARQVLAADTGKPEMQEIADAIREGAEAFLSRQYRTIGAVGGGRGRDLRLLLPEPRGPEHRRDGRGHGLEGHPLLRHRRALLRHRRLHRHVRLDPRQPTHRRRRHDQPQPGTPDRAARRRRLRPLRGGHEPARRGRALLPLRRHPGLPRTCPCRSWALASAPASWPSSRSSAAGSTRRPPTWGPTWSARSRRASPRTTRATPPSSPTSWATTSATARAAAPTSSSPRPPRTSAP